MTLEVSNHIDVVRKVISEHPEVDLDSENRGKIVDYVAEYLNPLGARIPWGRKSRNAQGTDLNSDGLTELLRDGRFRIIDILIGSHQENRVDYASWDDKGIFAQGENGFWVPVFDSSITEEDNTHNSEEIELLKQRINTLEEDLKELKSIAVLYGDRIGLQTGTGYYLCVEDQGVDEEKAVSSVRMVGNVNATRKDLGPWESLAIKRA